MNLIKLLGIAGIFGAINFFPMRDYAQNPQINFEKGTFTEIKEKAENANKMIFIDGYATWCGPCKLMDKNVFTNDAVAEFYNENFINIKMDMESKEGKKLDSIYDVTGYPTFLYINEKGDLIHQWIGASSPEKFIQIGADALNPEKQLSSFKKRYENREGNGKFIYDYLNALRNAGLPYKKVLEDYFKTQEDEDLISRKNLDIIFFDKYNPIIDSKGFKYVIKNRKRFNGIYSSDSLDNDIFDAYFYDFRNVLHSRSFSPAEYEKWKQKVKEGGFSKFNEVLLEAEMQYSKKERDWKTYSNNAVELIEKCKRNYDSERLNSIAWNFFENVKDTNYLNKAVGWAKKSVELESKAYNNDTYASLLYITGDTLTAIKYEKKAIELAKKEENIGFVDEMSKTLEKMKSRESLYYGF